MALFVPVTAITREAALARVILFEVMVLALTLTTAGGVPSCVRLVAPPENSKAYQSSPPPPVFVIVKFWSPAPAEILAKRTTERVAVLNAPSLITVQPLTATVPLTLGQTTPIIRVVPAAEEGALL